MEDIKAGSVAACRVPGYGFRMQGCGVKGFRMQRLGLSGFRGLGCEGFGFPFSGVLGIRGYLYAEHKM